MHINTHATTLRHLIKNSHKHIGEKRLKTFLGIKDITFNFSETRLCFCRTDNSLKFFLNLIFFSIHLKNKSNLACYQQIWVLS